MVTKPAGDEVLSADNFREFASRAIEKYTKEKMIDDALLWQTIMGHYEAALSKAPAFVDRPHPVDQARRNGDTLEVYFCDPSIQLNTTPEMATYITVDLVHVRIAYPIRISFDFGRDGWVIEQALPRQGEARTWRAVSFVSAKIVPTGDPHVEDPFRKVKP